MVVWTGVAAAQGATATRAAGQAFDVNVYPSLGEPSGLYDLNVAGGQKGPPGTIALTSSAPAEAYSFQDLLKNTHGYVSSGVSTGSGHFFEGAVRIPIVPGKAELELGGSTGQLPAFRIGGSSFKQPSVTYDAYTLGLALHPTENVDAYIGISGVRLHQSGLGGYNVGVFGPNAFASP